MGCLINKSSSSILRLQDRGRQGSDMPILRLRSCLKCSWRPLTAITKRKLDAALPYSCRNQSTRWLVQASIYVTRVTPKPAAALWPGPVSEYSIKARYNSEVGRLGAVHALTISVRGSCSLRKKQENEVGAGRTGGKATRRLTLSCVACYGFQHQVSMVLPWPSFPLPGLPSSGVPAFLNPTPI